MILVLTVRKSGLQFFTDRQIEQKTRKQEPIITATKKNTERHKIKRYAQKGNMNWFIWKHSVVEGLQNCCSKRFH